MKEKTSALRLVTRLLLMMSLSAALPLFGETLDSVSHYGNARLVADGGQAATVSAGGIPHGADFSGSASGNYTLTTGGADLWGGSDQGSFIYDSTGPRSGNFSAIVRMRVGEPGEVLAGDWGRSGLMARKDPVAANSVNFAHYRIFAGNNGNENTRFAVRPNDGANTADRGNNGNAAAVNDETVYVWLGLHRYGNVLATTWAPDNAGSPGGWSNFLTTAADSADLQGPVYIGLAHQNHGSSGEYAPEGTARQISTGVFEQFQVTDFNPAFAANIPVLPSPGALPGPDGTCDHFGVYEVRGPGGTLADTVNTLLNEPGAVTAQLPKLDVTDPETNGTGGPVIADPPIPYLTNTPGADDNMKTSAKGRLKVLETDYYTFNFHGDDGFAARVVGKRWEGVEGAGSIDLADPTVVFFPNGTGDHNTRATVYLEAGEYDFEYVNWEGAGGAYYEVTVHKGDLLGYQRANWIALGDPSTVPGAPSDRDVALTAPVDVYKFASTTGASPNGDDATAPSRFGNVGDGLIRDNFSDLGVLDANTHPDTLIQEGETPNPGQNDNYHLGVYGSFVVDNGNGIPGESLDLSFRLNTDDGSQLRIIGQSFTAVAGDARTYLELIGGDDALTGDFFTGSNNAIGHITLTEGTYNFEALMYEGGGGSRFELGWQPGHVTGGTWTPLQQVLPIPENVGIQLVDGTKSSIAMSFTSNRDNGAILAAADEAGVPVDSATGAPHVNWNSSDGGAAAADGATGTTAGVLGPNPGMMTADTGGVATPTGVTIEWSADTTWNTNNGTGNGHNKLMNGYADDTGAPPSFVTLDNLDSHFQDGYSVYVYFGSDGNGRTGQIEGVQAGVTYSYTTSSAQGGTFPAAYVQTTDTGTGNPASNYAVFTGLSGSTQTFNLIRGSSNSGFHGVQVVGVPHPAELVVHDGGADTDPVISNGEPTPIDYGLTPFGDTITRTFGLTNTGTRALVIPAGAVTVGPGFTVLNNASDIVVQSGETFGLDIRFDATGDYTSTVTINADCNCDIPYEFMVEGGVPPIIVCAEDITVNAPAGGVSDPVIYHTYATDESGTPTLVCTPPSGSTFPIGVTTVNCTATDEAGNQSMASFNVIVLEIQDPEAERVLSVVSLRGDDAVGAGGASGVPAGATIFNFNHAFINNDGMAIVEATLGDAGTGNIGIFEGDDGGLISALAAKGGASPFGGTYTAFDHLAISDDGTSSFTGSEGAAKGHVTDDGTTGAAQSGAIAPSADGGEFSVLQQPASASAGTIYTPANLRLNTGAPAVGALTDSGIWSSATGAPIVREGDAAAGIPGATHGHVAPRVVTNSDGEVAFSSNLYGAGGANAALWAGDPAALAVVAQRLDSAPGTGGATFSGFASESIGEGGAVAFRATLTPQTGVVTAADNEGIWTNRNGSLELIVREGDEAPCPPSTGVLFGRFTQIYVAEDGTVCFFAFLTGTGVTSANDGSFWRSAPDGSLQMIVREGQTANSTAGSAIAHIVSISCNNEGGVVYVARLATGVGDTVTTTNLGLWLDKGPDPDAELMLRKGDTFPLEGDDRIVTNIGFDYTTNAFGGTGGYGRIVNDSGDIMLKLSLDSNLSGLFIFSEELPE